MILTTAAFAEGRGLRRASPIEGSAPTHADLIPAIRNDALPPQALQRSGLINLSSFIRIDFLPTPTPPQRECEATASLRRSPALAVPDSPYGLGSSREKMARTGQSVAFRPLQLGDGNSFGDQHLSQHAPGAFTRKFAQRIVDGFRLTERKNSASLDMAYRSFREALAGSTPASIRRLQSIVVTEIAA